MPGGHCQDRLGLERRPPTLSYSALSSCADADAGASGEANTQGHAARRRSDSSKAAARPALSVATLLDRDAGHVFEKRLHHSTQSGCDDTTLPRRGRSFFFVCGPTGPLVPLTQVDSNSRCCTADHSVDAAVSLSRR